MQLSFNLPNGKEVVTEEFLFKDIRQFCSYKKIPLSQSIRVLESFIHTKNLNILEKFLALILLRKHCLSDIVSIKSTKGNIEMDLKYIIRNIGNVADIMHKITVDGVEYVLNYPTQFNTGNSDSILSIIYSIQLDDEKIIVNDLTSDEFSQLINSLPKKLFKYLEEYVKKNQHYFTVNIWDEKKTLNIKEAKLNILSEEFSTFIVTLFDTMDHLDYRKMLFVLSSRISDVNFLLNCTPKEIDDFYNLYKDEIQVQNQNLQK